MKTRSTRILRLPEYATPLFLLFISAGLLSFVMLSDEVLEGETHRIDRTLLLMFRDPADPANPLGPPWFEVVVRDITALGGLMVLGLLVSAVFGFLMIRGRRYLALFIVASVVSGSLINTLLKDAFARPRPDIVPHATSAALSSFPSGHAMMSAVVFLTLGALLAAASDDRRIKIYTLFWAVLLTLAVGISRIYLGVHWPTDILAGWIAGSIWALICLLAGHWLQERTHRL